MERKLPAHYRVNDETDICLCPVCLRQYRETNSYLITRINREQTKERCDFCNYRFGYDYRIRSKQRLRYFVKGAEIRA
ncbi:MAG: hypothetical protein IKH65_07420 [Clostridia bacterium]|nr:hypothetical protein [Clostridia bacterium]